MAERREAASASPDGVVSPEAIVAPGAIVSPDAIVSPGACISPDGVAYRARLLRYAGEPGGAPDTAAYDEDGLLWVADGHVVAAGPFAALRPALPPSVRIHHYENKLIAAGFIDAHIHYPQTDIIASPATDVLDWLGRYTYAAEATFDDPAHAAEVAGFFLDTLLACGTTTAAVYGTVHPQSVDAFFTQSAARALRMVAGKVWMDRHCPVALRDTPQQAYDDSAALIARWDGVGRQHYALTPRFAPSCSAAELEACGALARAHPALFIQSHLAESPGEVALATRLFPGCDGYLDIYDRYGLVRKRALYGHCIHLTPGERRRMAASGSAAVHCPSSNLFLGSGLFDVAQADAAGMTVALGTDVGGGTSFSMLQTMSDAYKVARMNNQHLSATRMFYLASAGAARALGLDDRIGTLAPGTDADFIVLDLAATPLLDRRTRQAESVEALLFALALLGDDRAVYETYSSGRRMHRRDAVAGG